MDSRTTQGRGTTEGRKAFMTENRSASRSTTQEDAMTKTNTTAKKVSAEAKKVAAAQAALDRLHRNLAPSVPADLVERYFADQASILSSGEPALASSEIVRRGWRR